MLKTTELRQTEKQYDYVPAGHSVRIQAFSIDLTLSVTLFTVIENIFKELIPTHSYFASSVLVLLVYFAAPLMVVGQTIGKKVFGLRVLPLEEDRSLNFKEAFLREVVGRPIGVITLCFGFLMIIWRDDKRGIHDFISSTVVMQNGADVNRKGSFFINLGKSTLASLLLSGLSLSFFYYSSFIADQLESKLTAQGIKVGSVSGNLANGFTIRKMDIDSESFRAELGEIKFNFADYKKLFGEKTLTLEHLKFFDAKLTLKQDDIYNYFMAFGGALVVPPKSLTESLPESPLTEEPKRKKFQLEKIAIKNFEIASSQFIDSKKVSDLEVNFSNLHLLLENQGASWDSTNIITSLFSLQTQRFEYVNRSLKLSAPLTVKINKLPNVNLKKPIDLVAAISVTNGQVDHLQVNAFGSQLTLTSKANSPYQLWLSSLTPMTYFDGLPFEKIDLYSSQANVLELLTQPPASGVFTIGSANFMIPSKGSMNQSQSNNGQRSFDLMSLGQVEAHYEWMGEKYSIKFPPGFLMTVLAHSQKIALASTRDEQIEQTLHRLHSKDSIGLARYFTLSSSLRLPSNFQTVVPSTQPYQLLNQSNQSQ